jgi:hypothetical protein
MRVCNGCGSTAIEHDDLQKSIGHETLVEGVISFSQLIFLLIGHLIIQVIHHN